MTTAQMMHRLVRTAKGRALDAKSRAIGDRRALRRRRMLRVNAASRLAARRLGRRLRRVASR